MKKSPLFGVILMGLICWVVTEPLYAMEEGYGISIQDDGSMGDDCAYNSDELMGDEADPFLNPPCDDSDDEELGDGAVATAATPLLAAGPHH